MKKLIYAFVLMPLLASAQRNEISVAVGMAYTKPKTDGQIAPVLGIYYSRNFGAHWHAGIGTEAFMVAPELDFLGATYNSTPVRVDVRLLNTVGYIPALPVLFGGYRVQHNKNIFYLDLSASYLSIQMGTGNYGFVDTTAPLTEYPVDHIKVWGFLVGAKAGYARMLSKKWSIGIDLSPEVGFLHFTVNNPMVQVNDERQSVLFLPAKISFGYHF